MRRPDQPMAVSSLSTWGKVTSKLDRESETALGCRKEHHPRIDGDVADLEVLLPAGSHQGGLEARAA